MTNSSHEDVAEPIDAVDQDLNIDIMDYVEVLDDDLSDPEFVMIEWNDVAEEKTILESLKWTPNAKPANRGPYTKLAKRTQQRKRRDLMIAAKDCKKIDTFFKPLNSSNDLEVDTNDTDTISKENLDYFVYDAIQLRIVVDQISELSATHRNKKVKYEHSRFDQNRLKAVEYFYRLILDDQKRKMEASLISAKAFLRGSVNYSARLIRYWGDVYFEELQLPEYKQGKHQKIPLLIDDEDVRLRCMQFIKESATNRNSTFVSKFKEYIEVELLPTINNSSKNKVSIRTCRNWLHELGFHPREVKKGIYYDGHEREDVVEYRKEFLDRMLVFDRLRSKFEGDEMTEIEPRLEANEVKHVLVVHDESIFNANDGEKVVWLQKDEQILRKKGQGRSIMVSAFLCECHGPLYYYEGEEMIEVTEIFYPGKGHDGYWTNVDLVNQLKAKAIKAFDYLHPTCKAIFAFDNSSNHGSMAPDALNVRVMNLNDGGKNVPIMRSGFYGLNQTPQAMHKIGRVSGVLTKIPLGIKTILTQRDLWFDGLKLKCKECSEQANDCCARKLLGSQEDFKSQKSWIQETVEDSGHCCILFPKFHPEFNFIEMYWAEAKRMARVKCDYSFAGLKETVPEVLGKVELVKIRRFARKCERYMSCYRLGLPPKLAEFACRKFKSHRSIPSDTIVAELEKEIGLNG
jgi:hypothetical protein